MKQRVRPPVGISHIRFDKRQSQSFRQGAYHACDGLDIVEPTNPDYVKGHAFGMSLRELAIAAAAEMEKRDVTK